ncbi:uncharacterized PPE family protein PPE24 [Halyomorpha halys]|uniref:uncharacterized PPE family protein PPE24 n=1 Tax=Halyomorpha halys TaxID=286706 RepID=UPI0034D26F02
MDDSDAREEHKNVTKKNDSTTTPILFSVRQKKQILQLLRRKVVSILVGVAVASPIVVRDRRSWYGGHGLLGTVPHGFYAPGVLSPASALLAASLAGPAVYSTGVLPSPVPVPAPAVVNPDYDQSTDDGSYNDGSYDDGSSNDGSYNDGDSNDGSYNDYSTPDVVVPTAPVVAPEISALTAVAPATFPPLDAPGTTPAPALAGPTLDGPTVPALVLHGPSGTIRSGPLSTGAVSLAGHVPPAHPAPVH